MLLSVDEYRLPERLELIKEVSFLKQIGYELSQMVDDIYTEVKKAVSLDFEADNENKFGILEEALSRYEEMYDLQKDDTLTLDERRRRVLLKKFKFDYMDLKSFINAMKKLGNGSIYVIPNYETKELTVQLGLSSMRLFAMVKEFTKKYIPIDWSANVMILFNDFAHYSSKTYEELSAVTWQDLKEKELTYG